MANQIFLTLCAVVFFFSVTEAIRFRNAYIQNVKSGRCVTVKKDENLSPLFASKCNCNPLQLWKNENGVHVINELATHGYMDELWGKPGNGEIVGNFDFTGANWQKWNIRKDTDGHYSFVVQQTNKCLREGPNGKIIQWNCDGADQSQKWRVVENHCRASPKFPNGRFQLQNPETGKCAVILGDSNAAWAKVVSHTCSCENNYHYWILNDKTLITQGITKQCMANWDALGFPGITQCGCAPDPIHNWGFIIVEDGIFTLVTSVDGKCVQVNGNSENAPLRYAECDITDKMQMWIVYDACHSR